MLSGLIKNYNQQHLQKIHSEIITMGVSSKIIEC